MYKPIHPMLVSGAVVALLFATGCTPLLEPDPTAIVTEEEEEEDQAAATQAPVIDTIGFEILPDGSPVCGGGAGCWMADEYVSMGLRLVGTHDHENCAGMPPWKMLYTYAYDAEGTGTNRAVWNSCSVGVYGMEFPTSPTRVSFEVTMNSSVDIEITATAPDGTVLVSSAVTRTPTLYMTRNDHQFRREVVTVEAESGIGAVSWETTYFGVILDNVVVGG